MDDFLSVLGEKVQLKNFKGFRGGLDTQYDHTGAESVYTQYMDKEIMFHVSTLLPFSHADSQQVSKSQSRHFDSYCAVFNAFLEFD